MKRAKSIIGKEEVAHYTHADAVYEEPEVSVVDEMLVGLLHLRLCAIAVLLALRATDPRRN